VQELNQEGKTIFFSTHILSDAETLCDRVAVLNKGELKGVGVVADLLRDVSGEVEVVWSGAQSIAPLSAIGAQCHTTGDVVRALVPERLLETALAALRQNRGRLISVTPVQATLEDYFLARIGDEIPNEVKA
jgi:ABC-2 type transport system ATP-binding protein